MVGGVTDPFIGSLIVTYSVIAVLFALWWLTSRLMRRGARWFHIDSEHWAVPFLFIVCFYLALVMSFAWPVILLMSLIGNRNKKGNNVRS